MRLKKRKRDPSPPIKASFHDLAIGESFRLEFGNHLYVKVSVGHAFDFNTDDLVATSDAVKVMRMGSRVHFWEL